MTNRFVNEVVTTTPGANGCLVASNSHCPSQQVKRKLPLQEMSRGPPFVHEHCRAAPRRKPAARNSTEVNRYPSDMPKERNITCANGYSATARIHATVGALFTRAQTSRRQWYTRSPLLCTHASSRTELPLRIPDLLYECVARREQLPLSKWQHSLQA